MTLPESYRLIKPSIVAIVRKYEPHIEGTTVPEAPFIIGTGFIVGDGLVATNHHVASIIDSQPRPSTAPREEWPVVCYMFLEMDEHNLGLVPLKVIGKTETLSYKPQGPWYGPEIPDVSLINVEARELPQASIQPDAAILQEGLDLATAGFPMGRDTLMAPGYMHQHGPTLQRGILGALLPFPRTLPHAFIVNVLTQGGSSGSPVFLPDTGEVVGIVYAGLNEPAMTAKKDVYIRPTAVTYAIPAGFLDVTLKERRKAGELDTSSNLPTLKQLIETLPQRESNGPIRSEPAGPLSEKEISVLNVRQS